MSFLLGLLHYITGHKKLEAPVTKQIIMETFVVEFYIWSFNVIVTAYCLCRAADWKVSYNR